VTRQRRKLLPVSGMFRGQCGQAMVFVLLMMGMVLLSLTFLYKAGKLTSEKMELQNAADSSAYSFSLIEARDLNFTSYLNRAIVANEIAIAQAVGILSWTTYLESVGYHLDVFAKYFNAVPIIGNAISGAVTAVASAFKAVTSPIPPVARTIGNIVVTFINGINLGYSWASTGFHIASVYLALNTLGEMVERNDDDAKLSDAGILSVIMHVATYHGLFSKKQKQSFTYTHDPNKKPEKSGKNNFATMAALVSDARDRFSKARSWNLQLPIIPRVHESLSILGIKVFEIDISFDFYFDRLGGTELRFRKTGGKKAGKKIQGNTLTWSAADVAQAAIDLHFFLKVLIGSVDVNLENNKLTAKACVDVPLVGKVCVPPGNAGVPVPTSMPFATGGAQASPSGKFINATDMDPETYQLVPKGSRDVPEQAYGSAAQARSAYSWMGTAGTFPFAINKNVPNNTARWSLKGYKGLPRYTDTNTTVLNGGGVEKPGEKEGYAAPYILVGVVKDSDDMADTVNPSGQLALERKLADEEMGAIAKGEVYFFRPNDSLASYFRRADGATEYDNAFNPYWQARLVDTNHIDRMAMLLIQQKQWWLANLAKPVFNIGSNVIQLLNFF
jgi:hypothetical protein